MSWCDIFIKRPVATTLLTLALIFAGVLAYFQLPMAPLPQVDYPTINVSANLPGADPETMAATVAAPLERALSRLPGVEEITSTSELGKTRITLVFDLDRNIDGAANDVQACINNARDQLPSGMTRPPSYRKMNPSNAPILILSLTSPIYNRAQMYDLANNLIAQRIAKVSGVANVDISGASLPAVRATIDQTKLNQANLPINTFQQIIRNSNTFAPKGVLEDDHRHWTITANDRLTRAEDFTPLTFLFQNQIFYLTDFAKFENTEQNSRNYGSTNGSTSVSIMITRQAGANIIETIEQINQILPTIRQTLPAAVSLDVTMESTRTIRASLTEVKHALLLSIILVILVVWFFLQRLRAALIPGITVPISLIATFAFMYLGNFSIDNLSLMALAIASGFVVDDAVVVMENISRHIEQGASPLKAASIGTREVASTIFSMTISLIAVFIPILLMNGIVGRMFREFAIVLSASVLVSLIIALTTTPTLCAYWLKHPSQEKPPGPIARTIEKFLTTLQSTYHRSLRATLHHPYLTLLTLLLTIALTIQLYIVTPKGFFPQQDLSMLMGNLSTDQGISFEKLREKTIAAAAIVQQDPDVINVSAYCSTGNNARIFVTLKPPNQRKTTIDLIIARLRKATTPIPGAITTFSPRQDINIGGRPSPTQYQYSLRSNQLSDLRTWEPKIRTALSQIPTITDINSDFQTKGTTTYLHLNRDAISRMNVTVQTLSRTLSNAFAQSIISPIYTDLAQYYIVLETLREQASNNDNLSLIQIPNTQGQLIPLRSLATWSTRPAPLSINHDGVYAAITFSFNLQPGTAFSDATDQIRTKMHQLGVPNNIDMSFQGSAKSFQKSLNSQPYLILAALLTIYLVLGILYESYLHPLTILSTLPAASLGALTALLICKMPFDIIGLIGVFLLLGIVKKNAIMMIDFAINTERQHHLPPEQAILQAAEKRLRPILMTTATAILGAIPLAIGFGEGSELRRPLGISIVGGLIISQIINLYTTPVTYLLLDRIRLKTRSLFSPTSRKIPNATTDLAKNSLTEHPNA